VKNPTYEQVSAGGTGHAESVQIVYDPKTISYRKLLDVFWQNIDPTAKDRQFCDVGHQYRSASSITAKSSAGLLRSPRWLWKRKSPSRGPSLQKLSQLVNSIQQKNTTSTITRRTL